jgi:hypothetical protein
MRRKHRARGPQHTTLDAHEQDELATKLRFGVGLEQLVGERLASELRVHLPAAMIPRIDVPDIAEPAPDREIRARAAALGVTAGRRGQWIRR